MRLLFIACSTVQRNATILRLQITPHLASLGHDAHVMIEDAPVNRKWASQHLSGVRMHYPSRRGMRGLLRERRGMIQGLRPDVVHVLGIGLKNVLTLCSVSRAAGPTAIMDVDELMSRKARFLAARLAYGVLEKATPRFSDGVVCASRLLQGWFESAGLPPECSLYLPYAHEPDPPSSRDRVVEEIRQRHGSRRLLVYVGTLCREYQSDEVLALAERMRPRREEVAFLVLGKGPMLERSRRHVRDRGLADYVELPGYVDDLPAYLRAADVLLFPIADTVANRARCPNKTFLYIGAQRPIVTNRVGEVEAHLGEYAFYYDFGDLASFEEAVDRALRDHDPSVAAALAAEHTWERRAACYDRWVRTRCELRHKAGIPANTEAAALGRASRFSA